jgi:hypothetical protein
MKEHDIISELLVPERISGKASFTKQVLRAFDMRIGDWHERARIGLDKEDSSL